MKTTIDLPDETFRKAKVLAAERGTTLRQIVTQALEQLIESRTEAEEKDRRAEIRRLLKAMRASNAVPMEPLKREEIYDR